MCGGRAGWSSHRLRTTVVVLTAVVTGLVVILSGCGGGGTTTGGVADQQFLAAVHGAAPDVATFRSDVQLVRLGHAACDGFRSGASFEQLADRLVLLEGPNPLPSVDLGAVIDAAVGAYCQQFRDRID